MTKSEINYILLILTVVFANVSAMIELGELNWIVFLSIAVLSLMFRSWKILPPILLFFLMGIYWKFAPEYLRKLPTIPFLLPSLVSIVLLSFHPTTQKSLSWMKLGKIDRISAFF
jgi:hypothetical protein